MSKQIVNLTELMVTQGIDLVLSTYPRDPYQITFQAPELRDKLILYVLRRTPSCHIVVNLDQLPTLRSKILGLILSQQQQIKSLIHEGIHQLLSMDVIQLIYYPPAPDSLNTPLSSM
ncbi:MAG: hypothetical protein AAF921_01660 [Cyanobacteria bacterium P01_D01_bin.44]